MSLGILSLFVRFETREISPEDLDLLDREGGRGLIDVGSREMPRMHARLLSLLMMLVFLMACSTFLHWSGAGLMVFVLAHAAVTVVIDCLRRRRAADWIAYSETRAQRIERLLNVALSVERARQVRQHRTHPEPERMFRIAALATIVGLPLLWLLLSANGWISREIVFANAYLPLALLLMVIGRLVQGLLEIKFTTSARVGVNLLELESDDTLQIYLLVLLLGVALLPLGVRALVAVPIMVVSVRLLACGFELIWLRRTVKVLSQRVRRLHRATGGMLPGITPFAAADAPPLISPDADAFEPADLFGPPTDDEHENHERIAP